MQREIIQKYEFISYSDKYIHDYHIMKYIKNLYQALSLGLWITLGTSRYIHWPWHVSYYALKEAKMT